MFKINPLLAIVAFAAATAIPAHAGLIGGSAWTRYQFVYTDVDGVAHDYAATLAATPISSAFEFPEEKLFLTDLYTGAVSPWQMCFNMDITDTQVIVTYVYVLSNNTDFYGPMSSPDFNGWYVEFTGVAPIYVSINQATTMGNVDQSAITAAWDDSFLVNIGGATIQDANTSLVIDVVPEPGTFWLLGSAAGLILLSGLKRRRAA